MAIDPVCGMTVDEKSAAGTAVHAGKSYHFCSQHCLEKFQANPTEYVAPFAAPVAQAAGGYTCPMHPEVRQATPGSCPKCGMALEPVTPVPAKSNTTEYVCPMHPEIVRNEPGNCPICGMALEPRTSVAEEESPELIDMTRRFWISTVLALPVFVMAMAADLLPGFAPQWISFPRLQLVEFVLATPAVL